VNTPPPIATPSPAARSALWLARRLPDIIKDLRPLQSHMMVELESRLAAAQEQDLTRDGLKTCVDYAFASMGARSQAWDERSAATRLPAVAVHPDVGVFILHQHTPAGGWLLEDASGNRHITVLPPGALYTEIQARQATGHSLYRTAGALFRASCSGTHCATTGATSSMRLSPPSSSTSSAC
jgi:hypothetical protein